MLSVGDDRLWIDAFAPHFAPVFPYVVPDLSDVHRVVDDGFDCHAAKSIPGLRFVAFLIQLIGGASKPFAACVTFERSFEPVLPQSDLDGESFLFPYHRELLLRRSPTLDPRSPCRFALVASCPS